MITRKISVRFNLVKAEFIPGLKRWNVLVDVGLPSGEIRREVHVPGSLEDSVSGISEAAIDRLIKGEGYSV